MWYNKSEAQQILQEVFDKIPNNATGCALIDNDGLQAVFAGEFLSHKNALHEEKENRVGAMTGAMATLGERVAEVLQNAVNEFMVIATNCGVLLIIRIADAILLIDWTNGTTEVDIFSKWYELNQVTQPIIDLLDDNAN